MVKFCNVIIMKPCNGEIVKIQTGELVKCCTSTYYCNVDNFSQYQHFFTVKGNKQSEFTKSFF